MPYLDGPQARHHGRLTHEVEASSGERQAIGLRYDPSRVAASSIGEELMQCLKDVHARWKNAAEGVMNGLAPPWPAWDQWEPWEAVEALVARYPGDVLPMPGLYPPDRQKQEYPRGFWYESEEEKAKRLAREESLEKGAYIAETVRLGKPDWAVEGEGG